MEDELFFGRVLMRVPVITSQSKIKSTFLSEPPKTNPVPPEGIFNLSKTVRKCFLELALKYNTTEIALTSDEVFSLLIGKNYWSKTRLCPVQIQPTLTYYNRILKILQRDMKHQNGRFSCENLMNKP